MKLSHDFIDHLTSISRYFKRGGYFILMPLLILFMYFAFSWGLTKVSVIQANRIMLGWSNHSIPFTEKNLDLALNKIHSAVRDNSFNAEYYYKLGQLYDLAASQKQHWTRNSINNREKAIFWYQKSLELRPTWSSAWANLAMNKTLNLEFDSEIEIALLNAMKYGAWESGVFYKVLWISLANWKYFSLTLQNEVIVRIKEMVDDNGHVPSYVKKVAIHFNWQENLQDIISAESYSKAE